MQEMSLQDKMKKLQKHQAFEAEIVANEELIVAVQRVSDLSNSIHVVRNYKAFKTRRLRQKLSPMRNS